MSFVEESDKFTSEMGGNIKNQERLEQDKSAEDKVVNEDNVSESRSSNIVVNIKTIINLRAKQAERKARSSFSLRLAIAEVKHYLQCYCVSFTFTLSVLFIIVVYDLVQYFAGKQSKNVLSLVELICCVWLLTLVYVVVKSVQNISGIVQTPCQERERSHICNILQRYEQEQQCEVQLATNTSQKLMETTTEVLSKVHEQEEEHNYEISKTSKQTGWWGVYSRCAAFVNSESLRLTLAITNTNNASKSKTGLRVSKTLCEPMVEYCHKSTLERASHYLDFAKCKVCTLHNTIHSCKFIDVLCYLLGVCVDECTFPCQEKQTVEEQKETESKSEKTEHTEKEKAHELQEQQQQSISKNYTVAEAMQFFVNKMSTLVWSTTLGLLMINYGIHALLQWFKREENTSTSENIKINNADDYFFSSYCVLCLFALFGLIPCVSVIAHRLLTLYYNIYLDKLCHYLLAKIHHDGLHDPLPHFTRTSSLKSILHILLESNNNDSNRNSIARCYSCITRAWTKCAWKLHLLHFINATEVSHVPFSLLHHSLMDGLGTMTVLALLNQRGLISDTVPIPVRLLLILPQSPIGAVHTHGQVHKHTNKQNKKSTQTSLSSSVTSDSSNKENQYQHKESSTTGSVINTRSNSTSLVCTSARNEITNNSINTNNIKGSFSHESEDKVNECTISNTEARATKIEKQSHHGKKLNPPLHKDQLIDLPLARSSSTDDNVIDFVNEMDSSVYQGHLHPLALCALMHATTPLPSSSSSLLTHLPHDQQYEQEEKELINNEELLVSMRLCDCGWRWGRAIHWLPRLCGFHDKAARNFTRCVRIVEIIKTKETANVNHNNVVRNKENEQQKEKTNRTNDEHNKHKEQPKEDEKVDEDSKSCKNLHQTKKMKQSKASSNTIKGIVNETEQVITLIMEQTVNGRATGAIHLFLMGTPCLVLQKCSSYWAGKEVVAFHESVVTDCTDVERNRIANLSCQTWQRTMGVEPVAFAHGVIYTNTPLVQKKHDTPIDCDNINNTENECKENTNSFASMLHNYVHSSDNQYAEIYIYNGQVIYNSLHKQECNNSTNSNNESQVFDVVSIVSHCPFTFLGVIGLQDSVHLNVQPAMSVLDEAGIRCMYFCRESDALTKSLGSRVGLPTDWNCCISLDEQDVPSNPLHNRAQMPFGVHAIRHHIMHVDAIPLQVNLFCHSSEIAQRAMLHILQDNHEMIMAVGSAIDERNVMSFTQAQLAMAVLPSRKGTTTQKEVECRQHGMLSILRKQEKYNKLVQRQDRRKNRKLMRGSSSSSSRSSSNSSSSSTSTSTYTSSDDSKHRSQKHHHHNHHHRNHNRDGHHHHIHHHHHSHKESHKRKHAKVKHNKTSRSNSNDSSHSSLSDDDKSAATPATLEQKKNLKLQEELKQKYEELMQSKQELDCWQDVIEPCDFAAINHLTILTQQQQERNEIINNVEETYNNEKTVSGSDTTTSVKHESDYSSVHGLIRLIHEYKLIAEIVGSSCALRAPASSNLLPVIVTLIEQARRRVRKRDNCVSFIMDASILVSVVQIVWLILCYTPICTNTHNDYHSNTIFSPLTVLLELFVIIPLLSVLCALSSSSLMSLEVMKTIPTKHNYVIRWAICKHRVKVWCARYVPSLITLLVLVYTAQGELINNAQNSLENATFTLQSKTSDNSYSKIKTNEISDLTLPHSLILHGYALLMFNLWLLSHAITHINRHECVSLSTWTISISSDYTREVTKINLWRWRRWQVISATVMCATFFYINVSFIVPLLPHVTSMQALLPCCTVIMNTWITLFTFSPIHLVAMCTFPFCLLYMDRPIKRWRCRRYSDMQKFRKLTFGTKLGMHSPCGDYEPESTSQPPFSSTSSSHTYGEAALHDESEVNTNDINSSQSVSLPWRKRVHEALFHYTTMYNGALELNCVCCDHVNGPCAAYHVDL